MITHNGYVYKFLWVFKKFKIRIKNQRGQPTVLPKNTSLWQKLTKTLYFFGFANKILRVLKNIKFQLKIQSG
jgi:hypothetical protein